jgi:hypothetical protein
MKVEKELGTPYFKAIYKGKIALGYSPFEAITRMLNSLCLK